MTNHLTLALLASACLLTTSADAHSRIHRSLQAKHEFVHQHACPSTGRNRLPCPGYVIDHVHALACGGADAPSNMQWQTIAEGKAKDKWELDECGKGWMHRRYGHD